MKTEKDLKEKNEFIERCTALISNGIDENKAVILVTDNALLIHSEANANGECPPETYLVNNLALILKILANNKKYTGHAPQVQIMMLMETLRLSKD